MGKTRGAKTILTFSIGVSITLVSLTFAFPINIHWNPQIINNRESISVIVSAVNQFPEPLLQSLKEQTAKAIELTQIKGELEGDNAKLKQDLKTATDETDKWKEQAEKLKQEKQVLQDKLNVATVQVTGIAKTKQGTVTTGIVFTSDKFTGRYQVNDGKYSAPLGNFNEYTVTIEYKLAEAQQQPCTLATKFRLDDQTLLKVQNFEC